MRNPGGINRSTCGFSLILMSIILTVSAVIFASILPGQDAGDYNRKVVNNTQKLERVEEAMRAFMAFNGRRPCPADGQYAINTANFGLEAATPGTCTGGTPAAPLGPDVGTGYIVGGVIPVRTLGLPDEYAFDEFGNRFTYVVDTRATKNSICSTLEGVSLTSTTPTGHGGLQIEDGAHSVFDTIMYAYISHGAAGYGAWPGQGSGAALSSAQSVASRINSGSTDGDMQINAGVDAHTPGASAFTYNTTNFTNTKVMKERVYPTSTDTGFDDLVWYRPDLKNTCCLGTKCIPQGFIVNAHAAAPADNYLGNAVAVGDVNGDGIPDLVIGSQRYSSNVGRVIVIFGTRTGFPDPIDPSTMSTTTGITLTGTNAIYFATALAVGDINGDGYADIIVGATDQTAAGVSAGMVYVVFGHGGAWSNQTVGIASSTSITDGTNSVGFSGVATLQKIGNSVAVGDVNGDGKPDIIIGGNQSAVGAAGGGGVFVVYGSSTFLASRFPTTKTLTTTNNSTAATVDSFTGLLVGQHINASNLSADRSTYIAACGAATVGAACTSTSITLSYKAAATSAQTMTVLTQPLSSTYLDGNNGVEFEGSVASSKTGQSIAVGDFNGDTYNDIAVGTPYWTIGNNWGATYVVFGGSPLLPQTTVSTTSGSPTATVASYTGMSVGQMVSSANIPAGTTITACGGATLCSSTTLTLSANATATAAGTPLNINDAVLNSTFLNGVTGVEYDLPTNNTNFGSYVAMGDVNGDGKADLVAGSTASAGGTAVIFGSQCGKGYAACSSPVSVTSAWLNGTNGTQYTYVGGSKFSTYLAVGDANGDNIADILIGQGAVTVNGNANAGEAYLLFGRASGWPTSAQSLTSAYLNGTNGVDFQQTVNATWYFGSGGGAIGDINGDNVGDLLMGGESATSGNAFIYFGRASGWPTTPYNVNGL